MADTPHFDRPFRLAGTRFAVVDQDTDAELSNAAWAIASTTIGSRTDTPDFGVPDLPFRDPETVDQAVAAAVREWEPRLEAEAESVLADLTIETTVRIT